MKSPFRATGASPPASDTVPAAPALPPWAVEPALPPTPASCPGAVPPAPGAESLLLPEVPQPGAAAAPTRRRVARPKRKPRMYLPPESVAPSGNKCLRHTDERDWRSAASSRVPCSRSSGVWCMHQRESVRRSLRRTRLPGQPKSPSATSSAASRGCDGAFGLVLQPNPGSCWASNGSLPYRFGSVPA